jgi:hypothetical protein
MTRSETQQYFYVQSIQKNLQDSEKFEGFGESIDRFAVSFCSYCHLVSTNLKPVISFLATRVDM